MNNNITEDHCSFEVSKLLKEKGFNISSFWYFTLKEETKGILGKVPIGDKRCNTGSVSDNCFFNDDNYAYSPTHSLAIKWIRENFHLDITVRYISWPHLEEEKWTPHIDTMIAYKGKDARKDRESIMIMLANKESFSTANEAALLHILQNLIK